MNYGRLLFSIVVSLNMLASDAFCNEFKYMNEQRQDAKSPQLVLERLKARNARFVAGKLKSHNFLAQVDATAQAQFPVAVVLNCMDARTPTEIVLDQGIGDIFAIRIAGNIQNKDILGSMEFGTKLAGAKLIVVMGHTNCGAIRGACQQADLGNLTQLLQKIQPAVQQSKKETPLLNCEKPEFINNIAKNNVLRVVKEIKANSPVLMRLIDEGKIGIIGAMQDLTSGKVDFFEEEAIFPKSKS